MCGRFDLKPLILGKLRPERLSSYISDGKSAANKLCLEAQSAYLFRPHCQIGVSPVNHSDSVSQIIQLKNVHNNDICGNHSPVTIVIC